MFNSLIIKELKLRNILNRILTVAPRHLIIFFAINEMLKNFIVNTEDPPRIEEDLRGKSRRGLIT